jgi:hypothetical protein
VPSRLYPKNLLQKEVTNNLPDDQQTDNQGIVHYEGGIPVFNTRLNKLEDEAREAKSRDEEYKKQQLKLNKRLVWFTGVLAFVGVIGGAISGYQAHVAKINADAARDNASAAKGMVEEMKHAREQAALDSDKAIFTQRQIAEAGLTKSQTNFDKSSKRSEHTFRDEQRAWLSTQAATGKPTETPYKITIPILNSGKTPAKHLVIYFTGKFVANGEKVTYTFQGKPQRLGVANPGQSIEFAYDSTGIPGIPEYVAAHKGQIFMVFGAITYEDVFSSTHWVTYCSFGLNSDAYHYCGDHNDFGDGPLPPGALKGKPRWAVARAGTITTPHRPRFPKDAHSSADSQQISSPSYPTRIATANSISRNPGFGSRQQ